MPYVVLLSRLTTEPIELTNLFNAEFIKVFAYSIVQSLLTSFLVLFLGFVAALGLASIQKELVRVWFCFFLMLPGLLPTLFSIISGLQLVELFGSFPYGFWGVVILHVLFNMGLVAVAIERLIQFNFSGAIELATVEGAQRLRLLSVVVRGLYSELAMLGLMIFIISFSSFSVPLVVGAQSGMTIEVLIYQSFASRGDLTSAVFLSLIQLAFIGVLALFVARESIANFTGKRNIKALASRSSLYVFSAITALFLLINVKGFYLGLSPFFKMATQDPQFIENFIAQAAGTAMQCLLVALFTLFVFVGLIFIIQDEVIHKILIGYVAPSVVLIGVAFYLLVNTQAQSTEVVLLVIAISFVFSILPTLYRLRGASLYKSLQGQVQTARVMGATRLQIGLEILLPQMGRDIFFLSGLAAFWACGDFALSSIITGRELTLGLVLKNILGGYRIELATVYAVVALSVGLLVFLICEVSGRVFDSKFNS